MSPAQLWETQSITKQLIVPCWRSTWHRCALLPALRSTGVDIVVFPILADPVDVKKGDKLCETVSQPSIQPDKVDPPMGS